MLFAVCNSRLSVTGGTCPVVSLVPRLCLECIRNRPTGLNYTPFCLSLIWKIAGKGLCNK